MFINDQFEMFWLLKKIYECKGNSKENPTKKKKKKEIEVWKIIKFLVRAILLRSVLFWKLEKLLIELTIVNYFSFELKKILENSPLDK